MTDATGTETSLKVYRAGKGGTYGVYAQSEHGQVLLEGGFFNKAAAMVAMARWAQEILNNAVETAERKAGWDPNP